MDKTGIADLTAHLRVTCGAVNDQIKLTSRRRWRNDLNHSLSLKKIVAQKLRRLDLKIFFGDRDNLLLLSPARPGALLLHESFESGNVDRHAALTGHQLGEIKRKSIGIVEFEGDTARDLILRALNPLRRPFLQRRNVDRDTKLFDPPVQRLIERLLLSLEHVLDVLLLCANFGKDIAHRSGKNGDELVEERLVEAERAAVANGAAQDAAQDVVAVGVAGLDAVGNGEAQRADVVGDDAEGDVRRLLRVES